MSPMHVPILLAASPTYAVQMQSLPSTPLQRPARQQTLVAVSQPVPVTWLVQSPWHDAKHPAGPVDDMATGCVQPPRDPKSVFLHSFPACMPTPSVHFVGDAVVGAWVVGAWVVGASVVGASVVGAWVVGAWVVGAWVGISQIGAANTLAEFCACAFQPALVLVVNVIHPEGYLATDPISNHVNDRAVTAS
jgi:hypothetical protein